MWTSPNIVLLNAAYAGTTQRLVFEWRNDGSVAYQDAIAIDNVNITELTCPYPSAGISTGSTLTTATIAWTENGTATLFDIEYGVTGFSPTGVPTLTNTTNPVTITGLLANTNYQFYVRSVCSPTDKSSWSGPYTFFTGYCQVSTTYTGDHTSAFSTTGAVTNVTYSASSNAVGSYSNQLSQVFTSYATQVINFSHSYVGGGNGLKIWVDWNNDLDFDDLGEEMFFLADGNATKTGTITIPATATAGNYRMRVRSQYGSTVSPPACGEVNYGTTIDFTLTLGVAPTCLAPSLLTVGSVTDNSATLSWLESGSATDWDVNYGPVGFTPTATLSNPNTTNPTNLTSLTPSSIARTTPMRNALCL